MPLRPSWAAPPAPPRMHFRLLPAFNDGTPQPGFLGTVAWRLLSEDTNGEAELPGITALNVMGAFVTDVKRLTLTASLRGQEAGVSSSPLAAGTQAWLSHCGGSPHPRFRCPRFQIPMVSPSPKLSTSPPTSSLMPRGHRATSRQHSGGRCGAGRYSEGQRPRAHHFYSSYYNCPLL